MQLQKCVFSLNNTSMRYGDYICTPNSLFNGRCITGIPSLGTDVEKSSLASQKTVRQMMTDISRSRLLDTPSLAIHLEDRPRTYSVGQKVLVWNEHILAKKKISSNIVKAKLSKFWTIGTVVQAHAEGETYMIQTSTGVRRAHRRMLKPYCTSEVEE